MSTANETLTYWFGEPPTYRADLWFKKDDAVDQEIRVRFGEDIERAARGELDAWASAPRGRLALVVLLDQFSRNVFRGRPGSFAQDAKALDVAFAAIDSGEDRALSPVERSVLYMPLMHSEDIAVQERAVQCFAKLAEEAPALESAHKFAKMHRDIVLRFGRFPHRNAILGRPTTPEEEAFLKGPGSHF